MAKVWKVREYKELTPVPQWGGGGGGGGDPEGLLPLQSSVLSFSLSHSVSPTSTSRKPFAHNIPSQPKTIKTKGSN